MAWNIQLLEVQPLLSLTADMRTYAAEKAESNPSVYYQLAVEIYLLLGSAISHRLARYRLTAPPATGRLCC